MARHILCIETKTRCNKKQTEINRANISNKSLTSYCKIKVSREKGIWSLFPSQKEKWESMEWNGIWKMRGLEQGMPPTYRANITPFT
jgi:hypothetical protein